MRILILGGTVFLGRTLAEAVLAAGHQLTLFHRGQTNPDLFPQAEFLPGDRNGDLKALQGRTWDAVIDTCGYFPDQVRASAGLLAGAVGQYTFISSISAYANTRTPGIDESASLAQLPAGTEAGAQREITGENYGPLKALCEQAAEAALPGRTLVIRPGLIVGPYDRSDRFTYWPWRVAQGGEILAPGEPQRGLQFIDVRNLAEWTLHLVEGGVTGIFNADGLPEATSMSALLEVCRQASGSDARFTWAADEFLEENHVGPWVELPLWIPRSDPDSAGFYAVSVQKALDAGLTFRPLPTIVADTLAYARSRPSDYPWRAGLEAAKEQALLAKLRSTSH